LGSRGKHRWPIGYVRKRTVEECQLKLDISQMRALIVAAEPREFRLGYRDPLGSVVLRFEGRLDPTHPLGPLLHIRDLSTSDPEKKTYREIVLTTTSPRLGGLRYWFLCPHSEDGNTCGRRVAVLYVPEETQFFGCRKCHDLSFQSVREQEQRRAVVRRLAAEQRRALRLSL
jgi:hypothetical protein